MRLAWILLALLCAMWLVLGVLVLTKEGSQRGAEQHPQFESMSVGGSGQRHQDLIGVGWAFGVLSICVFVALAGLGLRTHRRPVLLLTQMIVGTLGYIAVYTAMFWTYRHFIANDATQFTSWLPTPTAIMLFGLWVAPMYLVALYVWYFNDWVFSAEDEQKFQKLVAARRKSAGEAS